MRDFHLISFFEILFGEETEKKISNQIKINLQQDFSMNILLLC